MMLDAPFVVRVAVERLSNLAESDLGKSEEDQAKWLSIFENLEAIEELETQHPLNQLKENWQSVSMDWTGGFEEADRYLTSALDEALEAHNQIFGTLCADLYADKGSVNFADTTITFFEDIKDVETGSRSNLNCLMRYWPRLLSLSGKESTIARQYIREAVVSSQVESGSESKTIRHDSRYKNFIEFVTRGIGDETTTHLPMLRGKQGFSDGLENLGDNEKVKANLALLSRSAKTTHLRWPNYFEDEHSQTKGRISSLLNSFVKAINTFHFSKSDFQYQRILQDFWGTLIKLGDDDSEPYVNVAIREHDRQIRLRLKNWSNVTKLSWPKASNDLQLKDEKKVALWIEDAAPYIQSAKSAFGPDGKDLWLDETLETMSDDQARLRPNDDTIRTFQQFAKKLYTQKNRFKNSFLLSIRTPGQKLYRIAEPSISNDDFYWNYKRFAKKRERDIYLRGWTFTKRLPQIETDFPIRTFRICSELDDTVAPEIRLRFDSSGLTKNRITFLVDCSSSMGTNMASLKSELKTTLRSLMRREDIEVEFIAFGASKRPDVEIVDKKDLVKHDENKIVYIVRSDSLAPWKKIEEGIPGINFPGDFENDWDIWRYSANKGFDGMEKAIGKLKAFGETPLFAALYHAVKASILEPNQKNFVVVLTDGVDFVSGGATKKGVLSGKWDFPKRDREEYQWTNLISLIQEEVRKVGSSLKILEFNFTNDIREIIAIDPDENSDVKPFDGNISFIRIAKLNAFQNLMDKESRRKGNESLKEFLSRVFPLPEFQADYEIKNVETGVVQSTHSLVARKPINLASNKGSFPVSVKDYSVVESNWKIKVGSAGEYVQNTYARWNSDNVPLTGNENLIFEYSPSGKISLQAPMANEDSFPLSLQNIKCNVQLQQANSGFVRRLNTIQRPVFDVWSIEANKLTPSPPLAIVVAKGTEGQQVVLQDYNEVYSSAEVHSNLRRFKFPEWDEELMTIMEFDSQSSFELFVQKSRKNHGWKLFEFYDNGNAFGLRNVKKNVPIPWPDDKPLELSRQIGSPEFDIQLERKKKDGFFEYSFSVESANSNELDSWLIQVVDPKSMRRGQEIFGKFPANRPIERIYIFDSEEKFSKIIHKFKFAIELESEPLKGIEPLKGMFAIQRVSEFTNDTEKFKFTH